MLQKRHKQNKTKQNMRDKITMFCINKHNLVIFTSVIFVPLHFFLSSFYLCCSPAQFRAAGGFLALAAHICELTSQQEAPEYFLPKTYQSVPLLMANKVIKYTVNSSECKKNMEDMSSPGGRVPSLIFLFCIPPCYCT